MPLPHQELAENDSSIFSRPWHPNICKMDSHQLQRSPPDPSLRLELWKRDAQKSKCPSIMLKTSPVFIWALTPRASECCLKSWALLAVLAWYCVSIPFGFSFQPAFVTAQCRIHTKDCGLASQSLLSILEAANPLHPRSPWRGSLRNLAPLRFSGCRSLQLPSGA